MVLTESQFSLEALPYRQAIRQQRERRIAAGDTFAQAHADHPKGE